MDLEEEDGVQPLLTIGKTLTFKEETEDDAINSFISEPMTISKHVYLILNSTLEEEKQENITEETLVSDTSIILVLNNSKSIPIDIEPGKAMNINQDLALDELERLVTLLKWHKGAFSWEYTDMKGGPYNLCIDHIYIKCNSPTMCQPQQRMNPHLRDIVKEEIQNLLEAGFIYPILDNKWVSPLMIVPKKNRKWRVYMDYRELNKQMQKYQFPLPLIDQVLDTLSRNNFISFLDGFSGYNQI